MNRDMNYYIGRQAVALENTLQSRKTLGENFCSQWKAVCPDSLFLYLFRKEGTPPTPCMQWK